MKVSLAQRIRWIFKEAERDYIRLGMIIDSANGASDADPNLSRMERTLVLLGTLLDLGFQGVDLLPDGKCRPWPDQGRAAILRRIEGRWRATDDEGLLSMTTWFHLPPDRR